MRGFSVADRTLLLATALLAGYQVAVGIEGLSNLAVVFYSIGFGALMIAALMLIILDREALGHSSVMLLATLLPIFLALGMITERVARSSYVFILFAAVGFASLVIARLWLGAAAARVVLISLHTLSGFIIVGFPFFSVLTGTASFAYVFVGIGGAIISFVGSALAFQRMSIDACEALFTKRIPWLLFIITVCFTAGMAWGAV
ncbi:MAG: hypothetical protein JXA97_12870 [Anaerolineales bacterium]|nr:hypothetical protein [Anaerolineales bacterium]